MKQASKGIEGTSIEKGRVLPQDNTQAYSENQEKLMDDMNLEKKTSLNRKSLNRTYNHISEIDYNVTKADNKSPIMKKPIINEMPKATSKSQQRLKSFVDLRVLPGLAFIRKVKQANIDM